MAGTYGATAVGSADAIAGRLLSARQRASALLTAEMRACVRDSAGGRGLPARRDIAWEVKQIQGAIALLCQVRPERESQDEQGWRRSAERDFAEMSR